MGRSVLDPKNHIPTICIPGLVDRLVVTEMNPKCWERTKHDIVTNKYDKCLKGEDWIIDSVVNKLRGGDDIDAVNDVNLPALS